MNCMVMRLLVFIAVLFNSNICLISTRYVHLDFEHYFLRNKKKRVSKYIIWCTYVREFINMLSLHVIQNLHFNVM